MNQGVVALFVLSFIGLGSVAAHGQTDLREIVRKTKPGVVTIAVFDTTGMPFGGGSGFFLDQEHIVTCRHVVEGAVRAEVRTSDGAIHGIEGVSGDDPFADLVVLHLSVPAREVRSLKLAATAPEVGEHVVAIGSPLGLELTVSDGIVSSLRPMPYGRSMLQITAPVSQGSSGGPVLNMNGEVVGVTTSVFMEGQNLNFATPTTLLSAVKLSAPISFADWGRVAPATHAAGPSMLAEMPEYMNDPEMVDFLFDYAFGRAKDMMDNRDYKTASDFFMTAATLKPDYADAYYRAGVCELLLNHPDHAVEAFKRGASVAPKHVNMQLQLGQALLELGRAKEGLDAYREAIRLDSTYGPAWVGLGGAQVDVGDDSSAIISLTHALRLQPGAEGPYYMLGMIHARRGEPGRAESAYLEALKINPHAIESRVGLAMLFRDTDRYRESIPLWRSIVESMPQHSKSRAELGFALSMVGQCAEAEKELREAIRIEPGNGPSHYMLGNALLCLKRGEHAITEFTEAIRINPDIPITHYMLGMAYLTERKDKAAALDEYKILQRLDAKLARELFDEIYKKK